MGKIGMIQDPKADQLQRSLRAVLRTLDAERHDLAAIYVEHALALVRRRARQADRSA